MKPCVSFKSLWHNLKANLKVRYNAVPRAFAESYFINVSHYLCSLISLTTAASPECSVPNDFTRPTHQSAAWVPNYT